jgi:phosphoesterase RecJ-like protein
MENELRTVADLITEHRRFVLTTHVNPDGDGIGSEAALASFLQESGKSVEIINHSTTPAVYDFLDPEGRIRAYDPQRDRGAVEAAEVIFVLDTSQPSRLRSLESALLKSRALKVCIDHHLEPHPFADVYLLDDDATSTGEILYRLLTMITGGTLSPTVATALYTAIVTDTGSFRYPRVDPETHRIVSHLIQCGADPVAIYTRVYERWTVGRIRLLGETLSTLQTEADGKIAYISITQEMLQRTGTLEEDTDNFTMYPMSLVGVRAGILFLELQNGVKISFRSRDQIPINELAKEFGGNGHKNAAGARLHDVALRDVIPGVLRAARKYV